MPPRKLQAAADAGASAQDAAVSPWPALEAKLGYRFRRPELLALALTHRSFTYEGGQPANPLDLVQTHGWREPRNAPGTDNEQLEFLGDAVLGLAVTEALFREFPHCGEGELTRLRSSLVSRKRMAALGDELGLGEHLLLGRSAELNGIRRKPTVLANTAEAVIAAVYLDSEPGSDAHLMAERNGRSGNAAGGGAGSAGSGESPGAKSSGDSKSGFWAVRALVERFLLGPERETLHRELASAGQGRALRDHKTLLQERVQATNAGRIRYIDTGESGPAHQKRFAVEAHLETDDGVRVLAAADGTSKKEAQQRAAALALETLGGDRRREADSAGGGAA